MKFVHVVSLTSNLIIAVPSYAVSYVATWTGNNWIANYRVSEILCINESFLL